MLKRTFVGRKCLGLFYLAVLFCSIKASAIAPIVPEDVLSREEIAAILRSQDFFFLQSHPADMHSSWDRSARQYASHLLKRRDLVYTIDDVLRRTLSDAFPIRYRVEELYRADLGRYAIAGALLPRLFIPVGIGTPPLTGLTAFANLFGFLLPQTWLSLIAQNHAYTATKYLLLRAALDQYLNAEVQYIRLHRTIIDFEILNFYLVHLELLARRYPGMAREAVTLRSQFASLGTQMASRRGDTKLAFDELALTMALDRDRLGLFSADRINIANIKLPTRVEDLPELPPPFSDKEVFIQEVMTRSVELAAVKEFAELAAFHIGVTASSALISYPLPTGRNQFGLGPGFDFLPRVLTATSQYHTSTINVEEEFINLLNQARRAHDTYTNNLGQFTEGTRSLPANKAAFRINLAAALESKEHVDGLFMISFNQLVDAELRVNGALHGALEAEALMRRFLVTAEPRILDYLPSERRVQKAGERFRREYPELNGELTQLDKVARHVHKSADLAYFLAGQVLDESGVLYEEEPEVIAAVVRANLPKMLAEHWYQSKSRSFFRILKSYTEAHAIELTASETKTINLKMNAPSWRRPFHKNGAGPDAPHKYVYPELEGVLKSHPKPQGRKEKAHYKIGGRDYFGEVRRQLPPQAKLV